MPYISTISRAAANGFGYRGAEPAIGSPFQGGYYAGAYQINGAKYYLIVAPASAGTSSIFWNGLGPNIEVSNQIDGLENTNALVAGGASPAAFYCSSYQNEGYTDWYFPALLEMEIIFYNLKSSSTPNNTSVGANQYAIPSRAGQNYSQFIPRQTSIGLFQDSGSQRLSGYYWTSTQISLFWAYQKGFAIFNSDGNVGQDQKTGVALVRPVRRVYVGTV